jgi:hypothetical protein
VWLRRSKHEQKEVHADVEQARVAKQEAEQSLLRDMRDIIVPLRELHKENYVSDLVTILVQRRTKQSDEL